MKRFLLVFIVALLSFVVIACGAPPTPDADSTEDSELTLPSEIVLAVMGPFTGPLASFGEDFRQGAQLAADEINAAGGIRGSMIKIDFFDDKNDSTEGVNIARKVTGDSRFVVLLGGWSSLVAQAALPIMEEASMPFWTVSAASETFSDNEWAFKWYPHAEIFARLMADLAGNELGLKRIAIIANQTEYGLRVKDEAGSVIEGFGTEVVFSEAFTPGTTDFMPMLTRIKDLNADGILLGTNAPNEVALLCNQARSMGLDIPFVNGALFTAQTFFDLVGNNFENTYTAAQKSALGILDTSLRSDKYSDWWRRFEEMYGQSPEVYERNLYEMVYVTAEIIDQVGMDRKAFRDALENLEDFATATDAFDGKLTMGKKHWAIEPFVYTRYIDGEYIVLKDAPLDQFIFTP